MKWKIGLGRSIRKSFISLIRLENPAIGKHVINL